MIIRPETPADYEAITQVTLAAFTSASYRPTEHLIILGLRQAGALSLSLVAELDGRIVGHVAFSAVRVNGEDLDCHGLGPISVQPELHKQGIGSKLIREGLSRLQARAAKGCVLLGSPGYYQRFGFKAYPGLIYEEAPAPEYFMAIAFCDEIPQGSVEYHSVFYTQPTSG
jgi:putative acetyltransferase